MGLNEAVQERIEAMNITDELTRKLNIKISGCPNGCGQHHVASIGFTGASIKVGEHTIPAYIPHHRRRVRRRRGRVRHAAEAAPALQARARGDRALDPHYEADREDGEEWNEYLARVGTGELEAQVKDLSMPVDFGLETMNTFIDWKRDVPFEVVRGEGECAV